ncbi:MAG: phosphomethylpyrimidine synthase ThiC [Candidatus Omnitrophica bacterium]|nr:phosphomethylpyrimidine synthase ThiC [Candidatus Omnitrophota bacterium]MCM8810705.1 phosphomethylpyrimidine synthase ThiC [Candidatus Omnitrophota bacterium]
MKDILLEKEIAKKGIISEAVKKVAEEEDLNPEELAKKVAEGKVIILKHKGRYLGIGEGTKTKVNTNIGTSPEVCDISLEIEKLKIAEKYGTDTVMDLSIGGDIDNIRKKIIEKSNVPVGTVPIYQAAIESAQEKGAITKMDEDKIFGTIEKHAKEGVSFITVHCGLNLKAIERLRKNTRKSLVVSRGGAFLISWMISNQKENPLYKNFDRLLEIAKKYDLVLSLGDGLRPGGIIDSTDSAQIEELLTLGELTKYAWENNVQVIIEGPGHIPINEIEANVLLEKKICHSAPFYVLGPIVSDIAPGYDHITSAIGGAIAAWKGADFLCYVTPSEHLSLPGIEEVKEGVIAAKIAAHVGDIGKGIKKAKELDFTMDIIRTKRKWEEEMKIAIDKEKFKELRKKFPLKNKDVCTMCGKYCAIKIVEKYLGTKAIC